MNKQELKHLIKEIIQELTAKDLIAMSGDGFLDIKRKSDSTPGLDYLTTTQDGIVHFETPSHTTERGIIYRQEIKLLDLFKLIEEFGSTLQPLEIVRKAIAGNIKVDCSDPSWLYWGFQYKGTKHGYALYPEPRAPMIRNPKLQGVTCKHIMTAMKVLPFTATRITADLIKQGVFQKNAKTI